MNGGNRSDVKTPRTMVERRRRENGPPNGCDRRKTPDRRLPEVEENAVSEAEWFRRMVIFKMKLQARRRARIENQQSLVSDMNH